MGRYFDDFVPEEVFKTHGKTITETDVVLFAGITGDFVPLHVDERSAKESIYGKRIAHGLLVMSIACGLLVQLGFLHENTIALWHTEWSFLKAVFLGDTIYMTAQVDSLKEKNRKSGLVTFATKVFNQKDDVVQMGKLEILFKKR